MAAAGNQCKYWMEDSELIFVRRGRVSGIIGRRPGLTELLVDIEGRKEKAINYDKLTGEVAEGDRVILNTTAVKKELGTGGYHFVLAIEGKHPPDPPPEGHIMKLRYTPMQVKVLAVEEREHRDNNIGKDADSLDGMPVVAATLHSMLAPITAAFKHYAGPHMKVAYLMTDGAALPAWLSKLAYQLKTKGLIDWTVTCGHAFGGEYEAVNVYSGLLWARVAGADLAVVSMGPGIVGTAGKFGHTALEQGEIVNAVNILGGRAIAVPRVSFADNRERHRGLSHHTETALGRVALTRCTVPLPAWHDDSKRTIVYRRMEEAGILERHLVVEVDTGELPAIMDFYGLDNTTTMGRTIKEDPDFFLTAGAAGIYAARLLQPGIDIAADRAVMNRLDAQEGEQGRNFADKEDSFSATV